MNTPHYISFLSIILVNGAIANEILPDVPFKRMVGQWIEEGYWKGSAKKEKSKMTWNCNFASSRSTFVAKSDDGRFWTYSIGGKPNEFIVVYKKGEKKVSSFIAKWNNTKNTLTIDGGVESGLARTTIIHRPPNGIGKTRVIWKNKNGEIEAEWQGESSPKAE